VNDDLSGIHPARIRPASYQVRSEDDLQSRAAHLVLPRVRKLCTRTPRAAIPERIHTIVLDYRAHAEHVRIHFKSPEPTGVGGLGSARAYHIHLLKCRCMNASNYGRCSQYADTNCHWWGCYCCPHSDSCSHFHHCWSSPYTHGNKQA